MDGPWITILDLVDRLSASYAQRAQLSGGVRSRLFCYLARTHREFEGWAAANLERVVAAGRSDAEHLDATWIPNLIDPSHRPRSSRRKPYDVVFFGSLGYRPNVEALNWLAEGYPAAYELKVLVAGHAPSDEVRNLCQERGWALAEDYPSNHWLAEQATVAVAPLRSTAGIQNKVLEAATMGLPQVVAPAALAGLHEGFPALVADSPGEFVRSVLELVADAPQRRKLAEDAWAYAHKHYTTDAWVPTLWRLVEAEVAVPPRWASADRVASPSTRSDTNSGPEVTERLVEEPTCTQAAKGTE